LQNNLVFRFCVGFLLFSNYTVWADDNCIQNGPVDGYPFDIRNANVQVSQDALNQTMQNIYTHIHEEEATPDNIQRKEADGSIKRSYCLFHPASQAVYGTVIFFHGFSNRPEEMSKLASYLYNSGFNVYNPFLSKHYEVPGHTYWPKLLYRAGITPQSVGPDRILNAIQHPDISDFNVLFDNVPHESVGQNWTGWMDDAQRRFHELDPMPGPIYLVGLSLGSSIALNLGAIDGGNRIKGIVAHAPYLQEHDPTRRQQIMLGGPLDNQGLTLNGQDVSAASAAAQQALGATLFRADGSNFQSLSKIPTFLIGTESDISADTGRSWSLHSQIQNLTPGVAHHWYTYAANLNVGHAMTDPRDYPGFVDSAHGGGRNIQYKALYQETYDFLVNNVVDDFNMGQQGQRPKEQLPQVLPIQGADTD